MIFIACLEIIFLVLKFDYSLLGRPNVDLISPKTLPSQHIWCGSQRQKKSVMSNKTLIKQLLKLTLSNSKTILLKLYLNYVIIAMESMDALIRQQTLCSLECRPPQTT